MAVNLNDFEKEAECLYKNEHYSVRDNGAVLRYPLNDNQPRPTDNNWTFGKLNKRTGYLEIASVRVHRIVATAFHGEPPTKEHIVHHKDINKQNNRPENLMWVTKLEHVLLDPITAKKIAYVCGSVEAFLADPSKFRDKFQEPNNSWMGTVSKEDSQISYQRLLAWAKSDQRPSGGKLGEWIFSPDGGQNPRNDKISEVPELITSKTLNAAQRNWSTPSEFPCCPQDTSERPIAAYAEKLKPGLVFCRNDVYASIVLKSAISDDQQSLFVLTESSEGEKATKPWALAEITYENDLFVHTNIQSFFSQEGAEKQFTLAQGLEWTGGDSIDDYA